MRIFRASLILLVTLTAVTQTAGQEIIEAVAAVVGDKVVLRSQVLQQAEMLAMRQGISPTGEQYEKIKKLVLDEFIGQKVLLIKAKEDTVTVSDDRVEAELDRRLQMYIDQAGSVEKVEESFGKSIQKIKRDSFEDIREQLMIQDVRMAKLRDVQIYPQEVEEFFDTYRDSLPERSEMVKLRHILIGIKPGGEAYNKALEEMKEIQQKLREGATFEDMAKQYSEDPGTASVGGDLGFISKGELFPEFEDVAFRLKEGEVSGIVQTDIGLHLIKCLEWRGENVRVAHIFKAIRQTASDEQDALDKITEIRQKAVNGEPFDSLAVLYSEDQQSASRGGDLGWLSISDMQLQAFVEATDTLKVGEISAPFRTQFGYHLVLKEAEEKERPYSLEKDYNYIKNLALQQKQSEVMKNWVEELKANIHIKINEDALK